MIRRIILISWICFILLQAPKWVKTTDIAPITANEVKNATVGIVEAHASNLAPVNPSTLAQGDLIQVVFGDKADEARKVAKCESNMNPLAHNKKTDDRGIFQINYKTWHKVFGDVNYFDYDTNVKLAKQIYDRSGNWNPWRSSNKCHHLTN